MKPDRQHQLFPWLLRAVTGSYAPVCGDVFFGGFVAFDRRHHRARRIRGAKMPGLSLAEGRKLLAMQQHVKEGGHA